MIPELNLVRRLCGTNTHGRRRLGELANKKCESGGSASYYDCDRELPFPEGLVSRIQVKCTGIRPGYMAILHPRFHSYYARQEA